MVRVYVAGPYSDDPEGHTRNAIEVADCLWELGYVPFVPHLTHFWHIISPKSYEAWLEYDAKWLVICDIVLRLPGRSIGADAETQLAVQQRLPVVYTIEELKERFPIQGKTGLRREHV